jgi:hypothetical protein
MVAHGGLEPVPARGPRTRRYGRAGSSRTTRVALSALSRTTITRRTAVRSRWRSRWGLTARQHGGRCTEPLRKPCQELGGCRTFGRHPPSSVSGSLLPGAQERGDFGGGAAGVAAGSRRAGASSRQESLEPEPRSAEERTTCRRQRLIIGPVSPWIASCRASLIVGWVWTLYVRSSAVSSKRWASVSSGSSSETSCPTR